MADSRLNDGKFYGLNIKKKDDPQDHRGERPATSETIKAKKDPSPLMALVRKPTTKRTITARIIQ